MDHPIVATLTSMMDAVNAGDAWRYAALYAPDAAIVIHGVGRLEGRDAIEAHEVELLREFPGTRLAFYDVWHSDARAFVHYAVNGPAGAGRSMGHEGLLVYRVQPSGIIAEERRTMDSMTPMAQLGALGGGPARALPDLPDGLAAHGPSGTTLESENGATVTASLAALGSKNEAAFLASFAEDGVIDEVMLPEPFVGRRSVKTWFEAWTQAIPDATFEVANIMSVDDCVLLETVVRGTLKRPFGRLRPASQRFAVHRGLIAQVIGGTLAHVTAFMNGKELAMAVGQWPPR